MPSVGVINNVLDWPSKRDTATVYETPQATIGRYSVICQACCRVVVGIVVAVRIVSRSTIVGEVKHNNTQ